MSHAAVPELIAAIQAKLVAVLVPVAIEIADDSARHAGHAEAGGRAHLRLRLVSDRFAGLNRVARHRLIYSLLGEELSGPVHALNIVALTPAEAAEPARYKL